ncbi:MAG TPA: YCF48-related protein [Nitrospiria bacterium]|nr:YCF48-related protein [Nitrospiria bacterium]
MINRWFKSVLLGGIFFSATGLLGFSMPQGCSKEEAVLFEKFQYITREEGFKKPAKGELKFYSTNGPYTGGSVQALALDQDGTLYAGIFGDGVYRKKKGSDHWEPVRKGLKDPYILSLEVTRQGFLLAGTARGGLFRSENQGLTWEESGKGLTNNEVTVILEHKNQLLIGTGSGVFRSVDAGRSWSPVNQGIESRLVRALYVDSAGTWYAGTAGQGVFRSDDQGKTWRAPEIKMQGDSGLIENYIRVLAGTDKKHLFAGTFTGGIFRSTDGGKHWASASTGLTNTSIRTLQAGKDGVLFAGTGEGIFGSEDGGGHWVSLGGLPDDRSVQSMLVTPENEIVMGTANDIYFYDKGKGSKWTSLEKGMAYPNVTAVVSDEERGFYSATDGEGIFRSKDWGLTWLPMNEGLGDHHVAWLYQDSSHTLFAAAGDGIYRGDRTLKRWVLLNEGLEKEIPLSFHIDSGKTLYAGTSKGLYRREISSDKWVKVSLPAEAPVTLISGENGNLYLVAGRQLYFRRKGEDVFRTGGYPSVNEEMIGILPMGKNLFAWASGGIFKASDLESHPQWIPLGPLSVEEKIQSFFTGVTYGGNEIFLAGTNHGIFSSFDGGKSWTRTKGTGSDADVHLISSPFPGAFVAGTANIGVLVGFAP